MCRQEIGFRILRLLPRKSVVNAKNADPQPAIGMFPHSPLFFSVLSKDGAGLIKILVDRFAGCRKKIHAHDFLMIRNRKSC